MNPDTDMRADVAFSPLATDDAVAEAGYRTVSALAVVSLLVGIASPLCLLAPLLSVIPLFGAALAVVALRRIARSDGVMIGRCAALVGLALCVASVCAASSRTLVNRHLRTQQAMAVGLKWVELLQAGQTEQAFDLTISSLRRSIPSEGGQPAKEDPAGQFAASPVVKALVKSGQEADVRFERNLSYSDDGNGHYIIEQQYLVTPTDDRLGRAPMAVRMTLERAFLPGGAQMRWLIASYQSDDLPAGDTSGG